VELDEAIQSHRLWKSLLHRYVQHPDHSLGAKAVASPDFCDLGIWLNGAGRKFSGIVEYAAAMEAHERFHAYAGALIEQANLGQIASYELAMGAESGFERAYEDVQQALLRLRERIRESEERDEAGSQGFVGGTHRLPDSGMYRV
jgi:hypothetical protein